MTATDLEAANANFVASFAREARLPGIWHTARFANQWLSVCAPACAYLEILTKGVETLVILSYFEEG